MIVERIMVRIGRGEDYLLTATDRWQIQVLQESGYLLEDIQKEIADKTKKQERELKSAFEEAGIKAIERDDAIYRAVGLSPTPYCNLRHYSEYWKEIITLRAENGETLHEQRQMKHRSCF